MKRLKRTKQHLPMTYESPMDSEILQAYLHKNAGYNRADARRIKRALRKLSFAR